MNTRVLELIKNPKIITENDLRILESESAKMPYAQSIRALYLYGINLYQSENYKENLSKTAAYTTDKKILYHFINSEKNSKKEEILPQISPEESTETPTVNNTIPEEIKPAEPELIAEIENEEKPVLNKFDVEKIIEVEEKNQSPEFVVVDGEKNRLLYEGEENFLEEKAPEVDLDASKESGQLILKEEIKDINAQIEVDENRSEESIAVQEEPIVEEIKTEQSVEEAELETSNDISFGGIQDFLPDVKFSVPKNHLDYLNPPKKEKKEEKPFEVKINSESENKEVFVDKIPEKELEIDDANGISFENTQAFEIEANKNQNIESEILEKTQEISFENTPTFETEEAKIEETEQPEPEIISQTPEVKIEETIEEPVSEWKPMQFSNNIPDALIGKTEEREIPKIIEKTEVTASIEIKPQIASKPIVEEEIKPVEERKAETDSERPVFNVSFFGNEVSKIEEKKEAPPIEEKTEETTSKESNVGTFINTWQSWLKIERPAEDTSKVKEKIIDNFIENNPKISQLKEESNYVVKEKKDDISHLMTETLAKLYTEQKLYSKAIKAYETLSEKHPDKKNYFEEKIEEIKEIRKS
ncbi:hypothetical protein [Epilithonimonas arachidiradicis]|uniref:Tetratricopeptide repeat protein n=1 Tax=Epilithonimonas arachidiradicis TaxID=1617282 RepID=A0A420DDK2_9FLAO|nr:hypothetical protein [Epilithonimonas arachidiradicis]RKE89951.1 hypothetical protein BXY58_0534 [Epilithonimonas arachidiradicis]GGG46543.1 hypothetical protein GCM10007332_05110 [Epilithonimonas arachidiradicis]